MKRDFKEITEIVTEIVMMKRDFKEITEIVTDKSLTEIVTEFS